MAGVYNTASKAQYIYVDGALMNTLGGLNGGGLTSWGQSTFRPAVSL